MALDYRKCAEEIAKYIGGGSNVISAAHCATPFVIRPRKRFCILIQYIVYFLKMQIVFLLFGKFISCPYFRFSFARPRAILAIEGSGAWKKKRAI